jgi:hypothetical protein
VVRRTFITSSVLIVALAVAWSGTSASAHTVAGPSALAASAQHSQVPAQGRGTARTMSAAVTPGSSPTLLESFNGLSELNAVATGSGNPSAGAPPDPSIAVGAGYVVEAVNSAVDVFTRAGAASTPVSINAMIDNTSGWNVTDPQVVYDPVSGLFILMVLQYNPAANSCGSQIAVMVSQSNPALTWTSRGTINLDPVLSNVELTNVSLGLTASVVTESSDYKFCSTGIPDASQTVIIRRADLVTGAFTSNTYAFLEPGPLGLQPAQALTSSSVEYEVANDYVCGPPAGPQIGSIAVIAINGLPTAGSVSWTCTTESETSHTSVPPAATQAGTSATLATGTDRFLSVVWESGTLWVAGNTGCMPTGDSQVRSCLNLVSIAASSTGSVTGATQLPAEGVSGSYLYDPAIGLDSSGDVILTFDESSGSAPETMMAAAITGGTWSSFSSLQPSADFYDPAGCSSPCAWGAYSTAVQDPTHPTDVWVLSEYNNGNTGTGCATMNTCWNTFVGRYTFAGPTITGLSPSSGPGSGGQLVTVFGSDFGPGSALTFDSAPTAITNGSLTPDSFTFTTPGGASGTVYAQVQDSLGTSNQSGYIYVGLANYVPLTPFRILDTRAGATCVQCVQDPTFGPNTTRKLLLVGVPGLSDPILSTATAVVLNVTEVAGTANSLLTVYPYGTAMPVASNLNFAPGKVIPNLVTVILGMGGAVNIYNALGTVNVLADVEGYFEPQPSTDVTGEFHPISPTRVCDTRSTSSTPFCKAHGALGPGATMVVNVTGIGANSIPTNGSAAAAVVNLTGVAGSASTYLSLFPTNSSGQCVITGTSTLNLFAGVAEANRVMVELGPASVGAVPTSLCVYNAAGIINVVIDANGWFGNSNATAGAQYQGIEPTRICDTRSGGGACPKRALGTDVIAVAGIDGIPLISATHPPLAVIANLTAIAPTEATYLVTYPATSSSPPGASDINVTPGEVLPNLVVVQLAPPNASPPAGDYPGDIYLFNPLGSVNAVIDVEGWFQ